jgi:hypothetical protein
MKSKQYLLPAIIIGIVILGGLFVFNNNKQSNPKMTESQYENGIQVTAPKEITDQETGEVDQAAFEENQKVSSDNSLNTLEAELNSTVILEEDFSDL